MKRVSGILLATIVIIMAHDDAEGQLFSRIDLGGKVGLAVATEVEPGTEEFVVKSASKTGVSVGGIGCYYIHKLLAVQVELLFSTKGTRYVFNDMPDGKVDSYYIDLPLLAKFQMPLGIQVDPYLLLGAGFGILLRAIGENADGSRGDVTKYTSTLDIGPILGVGGAYVLGRRGSISFEARYFRGLTTLDAAGEKDFYNRTFTFMLGYQCCASRARK
jgi:hypothetical protein